MRIPGELFSLEGITCAGKTTMGREIVADLSQKGAHIVFLREPTTGPVGKIVRAVIEKHESELGHKDFEAARVFGESLSHQHQAQVAFLEFLAKIENGERLTALETQFLFILDGYDHLQRTILPNLNAGVHVLLDRFRLSTFAFGKASNINPNEIFELIGMIGGGYYPMPEKTYYIDIAPEIALKRLEQDGKAKDQFETLQTIKRTAAAYHEMIAWFNRHGGYGRIEIVNGERSQKAVKADIQKRIEKDLGLRF